MIFQDSATRSAMRTLACFLVPIGAFLACGLVLSCSDQPKVQCATARGPFAVRYVLADGETDCGLSVETVGVQTYTGSNSDGTPNYDDQSIGIEPTSLVGLNATPESQSFSLGKFSTPTPGADGICTVPMLNATEVHVPAVTDASTDDMGNVTCPSPALDVKYEWSNVRVRSSPEILGTEFTADLTYTNGSCTAHYRALGVFPVVSCLDPNPPAQPPDMDAGDQPMDDGATTSSDDASTDDGGISDDGGSDGAAPTDDGGMTPTLPPACTMAPPPAPTPVIKPALCNPLPTPENSNLGSGLNPSFPIECDPGATLCVLSRDPDK